LKGFLFDENVPRGGTFAPSLPVIHATDLGSSPTDTDLWRHAQSQSLVIVTKDADFSDRVMLAPPPPPWVVHLRFGNLRLREFHTLLARVWPQVESLLPAHKLISVHADRIESVRD
jgi:predicted nuclease of predicted toxin-antitoxin system